MSHHTPSDALLARFLADELSAAERASVEQWMDADPANRSEVARLREASAPRSTVGTWDLDGAWLQIDAALKDDASVVPLKAPARPSAVATVRRSAWRAHAWGVAAALVLVVGAGYVWRERLTGSSGDTSSIAAHYATGIGVRQDIVLDDSTQVALGPSSSLVVVEGYARGERTVELVGEAWFRVRHDSARPFTVRAAGTVTLDLGTEFSVRAIAGDSMVRVTVFEGAASLRRADAPPERAVMLRVHDVGMLVANERDVRTTSDSSTSLPWRRGVLSFEQASLEDVVLELRRWYAGPMEMPPPTLRARRVSATLPTNDLHEALEVLRLALGMEVEQRGDTVRFRER